MELTFKSAPETNHGDRLLLVLAFFLFSYSSYFLSHYSFENQVPEGAVELGTLKSSGVVRRRHARTLHWANVAKEGSVYLGDIIYTPKNTTAEVSWGKNEKIELEPDSMVQFDEVTLNRVSILLMEGKIKQHGTKTNAISVKKVEEVFRVMPYPKTSQLTLDGDNLADLEKQKTELDEKLKPLLANKLTLEEYAKVTPLPEEKKKLSDFTLTLTSPKQEKFDLGKNSWMTMAWHAIPIKGIVYQLELSREKDFGRVVSHKTNSNELGIQFEDPGTYYWRVKAFSGREEIQSDINQFTLIDKRRNITEDKKPLSPR